MAKKPSDTNKEVLTLYNRQGNKISITAAEKIMADHPELPDALTELFFSPATNMDTVQKLLNLNKGYAEAKAGAADRDAAIADKKTAEDKLKEVVDAVKNFATGMQLNQEWLDKASVPDILQAVKGVFNRSLDNALNTPAAPTTAPAPTPAPASEAKIAQLEEQIATLQGRLEAANTSNKKPKDPKKDPAIRLLITQAETAAREGSAETIANLRGEILQKDDTIARLEADNNFLKKWKELAEEREASYAAAIAATPANPVPASVPVMPAVAPAPVPVAAKAFTAPMFYNNVVYKVFNAAGDMIPDNEVSLLKHAGVALHHEPCIVMSDGSLQRASLNQLANDPDEFVKNLPV